MNDTILATVPVVALFGLICGAMLFLATYIHFPKMEPKKRLMFSLENALVLTLAMVAMAYVFIIAVAGLG
ncbi:MAG: hypothetical protein QXH30_02845 [Candidatus Bilamarchaeaceae archaeon]